MPEGLLEGRVVLVTGAAGGIGRAFVLAALALVGAGCRPPTEARW